MTYNNPVFDATNASSLYTFEFIQNMYTIIDAFKDYENVLGFWVGKTIYSLGQDLENTPGYLRVCVYSPFNLVKDFTCSTTKIHRYIVDT